MPTRYAREEFSSAFLNLLVGTVKERNSASARQRKESSGEWDEPKKLLVCVL